MYYDDDPPAGEGCVRGVIIITLAIAILGGIFYFGINRAANNAINNFNPFGDVQVTNPLTPPPTTIAIDRPAVVREIRALNRLETTTAVIDKVITAGQEGSPIWNFFRGDRLILIAYGEVIAGFDLSKLRPEDVVMSEDGATATITLPPAEILVSRLDNEQTQVYDRDTGIFTTGNPGLESEARRVAEQEILKRACETGILKRAAENGRSNIENLVKAFGVKNVVVNAYEGPCEMPGSTPAASP